MGASGITPARGKQPKLGLKPTTPQNEAGRKTEPLVWVPRASGTMPAATAAADPLEDPPGVCPGERGIPCRARVVVRIRGGVCLACQDAAERVQRADELAVLSRDPAPLRGAAPLRGHAGSVEDILGPVGRAVQRAAGLGASQLVRQHLSLQPG